MLNLCEYTTDYVYITKVYCSVAVRCLLSSAMLWLVNVAVALLAAVNTVAWGFCIREVGDPKLSIEFLTKLVFNRWFIVAMASAFTASILSYIVLQRMGVLAGRFVLTTQMVATTLAAYIVLGERLSLWSWIGIALIIAGTLLVGVR
jgi:drug/metabolite transporter (DMT)-like permease